MNHKWRFLPYGNQCLAEWEGSWTGAVDPFDELDDHQGSWRFYWRAKDHATTYWGVGSCITIRPNLNGNWDWVKALPFAAGLRCYGGIAFAPGRVQNPDWAEFGDGILFLPEVEWQSSDGEGPKTMRVRVLVDNDASKHDVAAAKVRAICEELIWVERKARKVPVQVATRVDTPSPASWNLAVNKAKREIESQHLEKVVLSRCATYTFTDLPAAGQTLRELARIEEPSYLFGIIAPSGAAFLGRSPERLLSWSGHEAYIDAIAGTRRRGGSRAADDDVARQLQSSQKDVHEQHIVADYVREVLGQFCTEHHEVNDGSLYRLKHVQHIISSFHGRMKAERTPFALLGELHPTPAVGGRPREAALAFLQGAEAFDRGWFAGPVGWTDGLDGDFAIGIRSALLASRKAHVFAGAGIVEGSDAEEEWHETEIKMRNFTELFAGG